MAESPIFSPYTPNTPADREEMLRAIGVSSIQDLFGDIPQAFRTPSLAIPPPLSEMELQRELEALAAARAYEFAFVVQPLKLKGATGSTVVPVAIR